MAKLLTVLSIILAGIVVVGMHPPLSAASIACIILVMAGAVVLYHEMSALGDAKSRSQGKYASSYPKSAAGAQTNRYAASGHWTYPGVERRGDSIELCPSDSVEQIARQMISTSFRQAWHKYHADHGGSHDLRGRIVQAQNLLLTALRRD
jgi:hypothetical protein